jgi:hypothetical protein
VYKSRERIRQFDDDDDGDGKDDTSSFEDLDIDLDEDDFILIDSGTVRPANLEGGGGEQQPPPQQGQQQQGTTAVERLEQAGKIPKVSKRPICTEISSKEAFEAKLSMYRGCCPVCTARSGKTERSHTSWRACPLVEKLDLTERMEAMEKRLAAMRMELTSGCKKCWRPCMLCEQYRKRPGTGGGGGLTENRYIKWDKIQGAWCGERGEFKGDQRVREDLRGIVLGLLFSSRDEVWDWAVEDGGLEEDNGSDNMTVIVEWLASKSKVGLRVGEGWVQSSKLCELVWAWG